ILGEVIHGDTHQLAVRAWGTRPKTAVPRVTVVLHRTDDLGLDTVLPPQQVQLVIRRVDPFKVPLRYSVGAQTAMQTAVLIGDHTFDVDVEDRFNIADPQIGVHYTGFVTEVLPLQPQRIEAICELDVIGIR